VSVRYVWFEPAPPFDFRYVLLQATWDSGTDHRINKDNIAIGLIVNNYPGS
jgi:hypothetical protein